MSSELTLYLIMGVMVVVALAFILPTLLSSHEAHHDNDDEHQRYLKQALASERQALDEDFARGHLSKATYESMVEDLARRALEETQFVKNSPLLKEANRVSPVLVAGLVALTITVSFGLYALVGAPELERLNQDQSVIRGTASAPVLREYLETNQKDGRAWILLARRYVESEEWANAADAYRKGRAAMTKVKEDPTVMLELAATVMQQGTLEGFQEAYPLLQEAQRLQPENLKITELLALAAAATEHWAEAQTAMETVLTNMDSSSPDYLQHFENYQMVKRLADMERAQKAAEKTAP